MSSLRDAPSHLLDARGRPRVGTYRGYCRDTDLTNFQDAEETSSPPGTQWLREKRWQWFAAGGSEVACGGTLFDAGYATALFVWVFDREADRMIADHAELLPPFMADIADDPGSQRVASLRGFEQRFDLERFEERATLDIALETVELDLEFEHGGTTPLTAIVPADEEAGGVNATQKETCLRTRGNVVVEGRTLELRGERAWGMLDYTHGLLPREVSWTWAIAGGSLDDGTSVGFNVSEDWNHTRENAVWLGDRWHPIGAVHFEFDRSSPDSIWHLHSEDGSVDVTMSVEDVRHHETNLPLVSSEYLQPLGCWHGRLIDREAHDLFGVAERHEARW
jgi:hypothetical protein